MLRAMRPAPRTLITLFALALSACRTADAPPSPPPATPDAATPDQPGPRLTYTTVATGLSQPLFLTFAPGDPLGRLFVVEKTGKVRVLRGGQLEPEAYVDLGALVSKGGEQGLLGLAFHPRWRETGRLFVNYTDLAGDTHVAEMRAAPDALRAPAESLKDLFVVKQPYANHNGGHLAFGPDGRLYVGLGDGGAANDPHGYGQSDATLLGKLLAVDVDAPEPAPRVVAKGLRNPWRFAFDRATGDLYIGDVGQNRWESVHVAKAGTLEGANFGWSVVEGRHCLREPCSTDGFRLPVHEYPHAEGCSITGGYVYRGKAIPELAGSYFFTDYCTGFLRSFRLEGGQATDVRDWTGQVGVTPGAASFGEDPAGELYLLSLAGSVVRIERAPGP